MALSELQERARFVGVAAANAGVELDEERWLSRVRRSMERAAAEELGAAAKVFDVPRSLRATRPEAYIWPSVLCRARYAHCSICAGPVLAVIRALTCAASVRAAWEAGTRAANAYRASDA